MYSNYSNFGTLEQAARGALIQAEQLMRSGRMSPLQSQQKNVQMFRVDPKNTAPAAGKNPRQAGTVTSAARLDPQQGSEVYREAPADPVTGKGAAATGSGTAGSTAQTADTGTNAGTNVGAAAAASVQVREKTPGNLEKLLKINFNEESLLSGVIMAEVLGRPKCLRRGRW